MGMSKNTALGIVGGHGWIAADEGKKVSHYFKLDGQSACGKEHDFYTQLEGRGEHRAGGEAGDCASCTRRVDDAMEIADE